MLKKLMAALRGGAPTFRMPGGGDPERSSTGLGFEIVEPGSGEKPGPTDVVTVRYAGWTPDGKRFDGSFPGTASFPLDRVIGAWTEGLQLVAPGGKIWLLAPPELAYGRRGAPPRIGPNATLVFYVELVRVGE